MKPSLPASSRAIFFIAVAALASSAGLAPAQAQNAYITNTNDNTVSVIDTTTNAVTATIPVGKAPVGVAVAPDGSAVYVTNGEDNTVSVIDTTSNVVAATIPVGLLPDGAAVTPDGSKVYVANEDSSTVSVIATASNTVSTTISDVGFPGGLAITPDGGKVYVTSTTTGAAAGSMIVIDTGTDTVIGSPIPVCGFRCFPTGVAISPDGSSVYVTREGPGDMAVIDTATNNVTTVRLAGFGTSPIGVVVSPDGSTIYVAVTESPPMVWVIAAATNNVITTIPMDGAAGEAEGIAVTPDGSKVFVANGFSNTATSIDAASNTVIATISVGRNAMAFGQFIGPAPAGPLASGGQCNGRFTGSFDGNIRVSAGQSCVFIRPCDIAGSVRVTGGTFNLGCTVEGHVTEDNGTLILGRQARVDGTVQIRETSAFALDAGSEIGGDLHIRDLVASLPLGTVCGIKVRGSLQIHGNASPIEIGATNANICAGNTVGDNFQAGANSASLLIDNNKIGGSLRVNSNSGSTNVSGNTIGGDLRCHNNTSITSVAPNIVGGKARGQCRVFPGMEVQGNDGM